MFFYIYYRTNTVVKAHGFDVPTVITKKRPIFLSAPLSGLYLRHSAIIGTVPSVYSSVSFQVQLTNLNSPLLSHSNTMVSAFVAPS